MEIGYSNFTEAAPCGSPSLVFRWVRIIFLPTKRLLIGSSGGVRGIVELQVLKQIEQKLGGNIRIQDFFDLIVGTR